MDYKESVRAGPEEKNLVLTVHRSDQCGNAQNCKYPYSGIGTTPEELKKLFCYDHTFIRFKNNYRSKENFLEATIAALDNDNDHSDDPKDWVGILDIPKLFPNVPCIVSTSRHHMRPKGKGKAQMEDLQDVTMQLANFREVMPMRLYVDDVTTEKLTSVLAENNGTAAIVSAEGGIFDMLAGIYTKNVNIDVFLKAHSGDDIRVDRIGRSSESISLPALTVLLAVQPSVLSGMMSNGVFRGRGLTARFMYCMPQSKVGERKYRTKPIPDEVSRCYEVLIRNLLQEGTPKTPELLRLSPEADKLLESFAGEVEGKLKNEYSDIPDWAGKLTGAVLRISGLLCRAANAHCSDFLDISDSMIVSEEAMAGAISIGRYFTEHARAAYSLMGADDLVKQNKYTLDGILKNGLLEFSRRDIMRICRSFKKAEQVQPVLNHLADLGYVALKETEQTASKGRPGNPTYLVNPLLYQQAA